MTLRDAARKLPYPLRQGLKYVYGTLPPRVRYGPVFWETYTFLQESQWWGIEALRDYQMEQLHSLLRHVIAYVPFYRQWFAEHGGSPDDVLNGSSLCRLPLLSKSLIEDQKQAFFSDVHSRCRLEPAHTGGTTGSPMHFSVERGVTRGMELAFFKRMWQWHGFNPPRDKSIRIGGAFQPDERVSYDPLNRSLQLVNPSFTLQQADKYLKIIESFRPVAILGYPSLIYALAHIINRYGLTLRAPALSVVFCASEKPYDFQREEIATAFGCRVVDHYGHNEMLALLQKCEQNSDYHVIMEYGIVEVLGADGLPVSRGGQCGELVATGFNNRAFPMLRYRTDDWVILSDDSTPCSCGRAYPRVKDVIGRSGDFILTPSGRLVSSTNIEFAIRFIKNFRDVQIVQLARDLVEVQIVPDRGFSQDEAIRFADGVKARIGEEVEVRITMLDAIERPFSQKRRFVKSDIAREFLGLDTSRTEGSGIRGGAT